MQLLNLLIILTIASLLTTLVSKLFVSKRSINSSFIRRVIRIFSFLIFTLGLSYASTFLPFGSITYGQRQAKYFYYSNEGNLRLIVKQFEELSKKGLWTIIKQKGELNKIEITINDTVFYYSDLNKQSVDDILRKSEIDKSELNRIIALFN